MLNRRTFLQQSSASLLLLPTSLAQARNLRADVAILGAGVGGCAAALAALRNGMRVVMTEETDWVGGQLTSQAVPPDEHPWIEQFGGTQLYRRYRTEVRQYYRRNFKLRPEVNAMEWLNPGGKTTRCFAPKVCRKRMASLAFSTTLLCCDGSFTGPPKEMVAT